MNQQAFAYLTEESLRWVALQPEQRGQHKLEERAVNVLIALMWVRAYNMGCRWVL